MIYWRIDYLMAAPALQGGYNDPALGSMLRYLDRLLRRRFRRKRTAHQALHWACKRADIKLETVPSVNVGYLWKIDAPPRTILVYLVKE